MKCCILEENPQNRSMRRNIVWMNPAWLKGPQFRKLSFWLQSPGCGLGDGCRSHPQGTAISVSGIPPSQLKICDALTRICSPLLLYPSPRRSCSGFRISPMGWGRSIVFAAGLRLTGGEKSEGSGNESVISASPVLPKGRRLPADSRAASNGCRIPQE